MGPSFVDQLAVDQIGPGEYASRLKPVSHGNPGGIVYGGCTMGVATNAAFATVPTGYFLYSLMGHFLGPATVKSKLYCSVDTLRDTKTFATRRVVVKQLLPDGTTRSCLEVLADFQVEEPALLTYTTPPTLRYKSPHESPTLKQMVDKALSDGHIQEDPIAKSAPMFYAADTYFETKTCTEGMSGQNLVGMLAKVVPTDQDGLPVTGRVSSDWARLRMPAASVAEQAAALAYLMDGGIPFVTLAHNHLWYSDCGPCSTLDFALRVFVPVVDLKKWHVRERKTIVAGYGRAYNEGRLFDEQGNLVASMTEQCILRPKPKPAPKSSL